MNMTLKLSIYSEYITGNNVTHEMLAKKFGFSSQHIGRIIREIKLKKGIQSLIQIVLESGKSVDQFSKEDLAILNYLNDVSEIKENG